ncbi:BTAD domain-containing putative transcriptional regulator [Embleya scabrispora]|uniref:BTAD domain-containing putative transcriptional regulator n=1 Tax=Embleya scabrispora TaxID=159449 RepID=UPI00037DF61C|nr:BTAD domain-containing putative transcriptional regulator [Embleya scabrispora]MYS84312.1 AfsR/SARP family transcriptional regulator [Streptomyces sp. SID5474]
MQISVLGPLQAWDDDGRLVTIGGARLRALLIRLVLDPGRPVSADRLIAAVWGDDPPAGAGNALQSLISRLRRQLPVELDSGPAGYVLRIRPEDVDAHMFGTLAVRGRRQLGERDPAGAAETLGRALALWRGSALADAADAPFAIGPAARLVEQRLGAIEDRAQAQLALGHSRGLAAELEQLTREYPLRERLYGLLIRTLHEEGRRADALTLYQDLRERLADELGIDPSPDLEAAYLAVLRGGEPRPAAPAPAPAAPSVDRISDAPRPAPGNVPARLTTFVGREDEVVRVDRLLAESRLVTVVGPGGAGKTRLSTEAGARIAARGRGVDGGVWFVELAPVLDPLDVPQAVLTALGRREVGLLDTHVHGSGRDVVERIVELLAGRPSVLILDNCEHLIAAAAAIAGRLLARTPTLRILTTSREPLGIDGEMLCPLGPLALPPVDVDAAEGMAYASVRLFADRARAVRPGLVIDADTIGAVAEICRRLDGQPLAIELAAARTRSLTPTQIAGRLDDRFRLLTGGSRTALPRHQTLRAVVEWSWDLLEKRERVALRRLSVFAGGTTLEAAEAVLPGTDFAAADVLDLLAGLVDKSLVDVMGTTETRYRLLETIQAYASERLVDAGETEATAARHAQWFTHYAEEADARLRGPGQIEAINRIAAEHDNLAVVLRYAVDHTDAELAVRLIDALSWFWAMRGNHGEAHAWGHEGLAVPGPAPRDKLAGALAFHALHAFSAGERWEAVRSYARARLIIRRLGADVTPVLPVFIEMLAAVVRQDNSSLSEALIAADALGDEWTQAMARLMRGHFAVNLGHPEEAVSFLTDARDRFGAMGDRWGRASAISGLAELLMFTSDFEGALAAVNEALELLRELQAEDEIPQLMVRRGMIHARAGDLDLARQVMLDLSERVEVRATPLSYLFGELGLGELARYVGDFEEAERRYENAFAELPNTRLLPPQLIGSLHIGRGHVACGRDDPGTARFHFEAAVPYALEGQDMPVLGSCIEGFAALALAGGDLERAALLLGAAQVVRGHPDLSDIDADRVRRALEARMGAEEFARAKAVGSVLDTAEAVALIHPETPAAPTP